MDGGTWLPAGRMGAPSVVVEGPRDSFCPQLCKDCGHWLGRAPPLFASQARANASRLFSPEPAFGDHVRLCQHPQLQPLPLPHRAQRVRGGRAGQLPEGPEL